MASNLIAMASNLVASLLLVEMPFVTGSFLLLVVWPGATSSVLATSSDGLPYPRLKDSFQDFSRADRAMLSLSAAWLDVRDCQEPNSKRVFPLRPFLFSLFLIAMALDLVVMASRGTRKEQEISFNTCGC